MVVEEHVQVEGEVVALQVELSLEQDLIYLEGVGAHLSIAITELFLLRMS